MNNEQIKEVMRLSDDIRTAHTSEWDVSDLVEAQNDLEAYLRTIGEPENTFPLNPNGSSKWAHLQKHDGAQAIGVVFRTGSGSVGSLVDGRVVWADWLAHPNGSKPESVNAELLEAIEKDRDAADSMAKDLANLCVEHERRFEFLHSTNMDASGYEWGIYRVKWDSGRAADVLQTLSDLSDLDAAIARAESAMPFWPDHSSAISDPLFHQARGIMGTENFGQEEGLRLAILHVLNARAESAIETPAKVSPCAGHAVQQDADDLVGLRGCNSRHGGMRALYPCIYRMRTTDPGCTGCVERDEDQPEEAGHEND